MKKNITIIVIIILFFSILFVGYYLFFNNKEEANKLLVIFVVINGDTNQAITNQEIYICDDSLKIDYFGDFPFSRFCDEEHIKIIKKVKTNSNGELVLDINKINVKPPTSIIFDIGNSDDRWGFVGIERSDGLGHTYSPLHLRVLNKEKSGRVISNKIYNLETKEVKEIFTFDKSEKNYTFEKIELIIFMR